MFLEDLNQNVSLLGFRRVIDTSDRWRHDDLAIEIQGICMGEDYLQDQKGIQIWEDVWQTRKAQVIHFLTALTKPLKSVFARDTRIVPISAEAARHFLDANHLMGFSKGALYVGCVVPPHRQFRGIGSEFSWEGNPLVAVAVFGKPLVMKEAGLEGELSGELIKLATLPSIRLVGGITKFLDAYHAIHPVQNVMTYIDLDWNSGKGFLSIGFKVIEQTPPLFFKLVDGKRIAVTQNQDAEVWTKGNLKLRYYYAN
ncbi:hypothetical protein U0R10_04955 [Aquirufa sp. OSTEICH-129V]|uniref:GNAT family N-acetyltransferase n=1 Tax=Aquirufa avitistagni TaxID=3104728 RepID=A0ABW6DCX4_9BACT